MRKVVYKTYLAWDFEREEKWLNSMSAKGLQLVGVSFCRYVFEEGEPNEYIYRLEMLDDLPESYKGQKYINFIEETGAERIGSILRWVYFRKTPEKGGFDLFSDVDSRIKHLNRIVLLIAILCWLPLFSGFNALQNFNSGEMSSGFVLGIICICVGAFLVIGLIIMLIKRHKLVKEKILHE